MAVLIDIRYHSEWDDGFGARGWKLESTIGDERVIASTPFTGDVSETSVFVHDIVDHHLCGLGIGGHRNEAIAVFLHALRSGVPIDSSIAFMVEDILATGECGEELETFLPADMFDTISVSASKNQALIGEIINYYGICATHKKLVEHYYRIGAEGISNSLSVWSSHGLDNERRPAIGRCIQKLLLDADSHVQNKSISVAYGQIYVGNSKCKLVIGSREWLQPVVMGRKAFSWAVSDSIHDCQLRNSNMQEADG